MLKLNAYKTEVIVYASKRNSCQVCDLSVKVGDSEIKPSSSVKTLGTFLDSHMDMEQHVNTICRSSYAEIRKIGKTRQYLTNDATKSLVKPFVTARLT